MFDMGFYPDLRKLIKVVPPADRRQTMLFSATLNAWVKNLAWEYTKSPFEIEIAPETVTVEEIVQVLYHVPSEDKMKLLLGILEQEKPESAIIFCNTKRYTEIVSRRLRMNGFDCEFIIGDLPQSRRLKVIDDVKAGKIKFLVATDVAARGLDIEGLAMVVNYDLPVEAENYVHRIGRTARAGKTGKAVTLASEQDVYELPAIERYIGKKIPSEIAVPELFAEDKSAGQHVRTEFYEDRREARHLHGNAKAGEGRGARPHGQDRGGERRDGRSGERRDGRSAGRTRGSRNAEGRRSGADVQRGGAAAAGKGQRQEGGKDLSRLSFEERMAMYKKKYDSVQPDVSRDGGTKKAAGGKAEMGGKGRKQGGRGGRDNVRQGAASQLPPGKKSANSGGGKRPGTRNGRPKDAQHTAPQKAAAPEKKGILSRFLGIFKKQGKGEP
jgi:ATP-dependent RNA helicase RhlB